MRSLEGHKINPANDKLEVEVLDQPGAGGACHHYRIRGFDTANNSARFGIDGWEYCFSNMPIIFQNGPIAEAGVNGVTHEALLSILIDRIAAFQAGPYANSFNAEALVHLEGAQAALLARTQERMGRGVEGTSAE